MRLGMGMHEIEIGPGDSSESEALFATMLGLNRWIKM
jgi:hypothetical protein